MTAAGGTPDPADRLEQALNAAVPYSAAFVLAEKLRDEGMSQQDLHSLYERFRALHAEDADQTRLDAVLDTLDFITGWCSPGRGLFQKRLDSKE